VEQVTVNRHSKLSKPAKLKKPRAFSLSAGLKILRLFSALFNVEQFALNHHDHIPMAHLITAR
jgi:hypothetical protein